MAAGAAKTWTRGRLLVVTVSAVFAAAAMAYAVHDDRRRAHVDNRTTDVEYGCVLMIADTIRRQVDGGEWPGLRRLRRDMYPGMLVLISNSTIRVVGFGDDNTPWTADDRVLEVPVPK